MLNKFQFHSLVTSVLLLPTLVLTAQKADVHPLDFIYKNSTNYPIYEMYGSVNSTNNWVEDVLVEDILSSNQSSQSDFYDDADNCLFDIQLCLQMYK